MKHLLKWIALTVEEALTTPHERLVILDRVQWEINKALEDARATRTVYDADAPPPACPTCPPTP